MTAPDPPLALVVAPTVLGRARLTDRALRDGYRVLAFDSLASARSAAYGAAIVLVLSRTPGRSSARLEGVPILQIAA